MTSGFNYWTIGNLEQGSFWRSGEDAVCSGFKTE